MIIKILESDKAFTTDSEIWKEYESRAENGVLIISQALYDALRDDAREALVEK